MKNRGPASSFGHAHTRRWRVPITVSLALCLAVIPLSMASQRLNADAGVRQPLRLCAEVYAELLENPSLARAIDQYGIGEIDIHRANIANELPVPEFPRLKRNAGNPGLAAFRVQLQRFKKRGVRIMLSGPEPNLPRDFFEAYPEARDVSNGLLWDFLEKRTLALFRAVPEADSVRFHLWETDLLSDSNYFGGLYWARPADIYRTPSQYYSPSDYLKQLGQAFSRAAVAAGKQFTFTTFSHFPWQERLLVEALRSIDQDVPLTLMHIPLAGDFDPFRPPNSALELITDRDSVLLFDAFGEYWGWSLMPYCFPDDIQRQLRYGLAHNSRVNAVASRISFNQLGLTVFGSLNEINFYALARLAKNPDTPVEDIWRTWAEIRFGKTAAPKVISALRRTSQIGNLTYYYKGVWLTQHSVLTSDLRYMEAKVLHTGRSMIEWAPQNITDNALIHEFLEHPSERTIQMIISDRLEALRLNRLSMEDVASVKASLPSGQYEMLNSQFTLQRHFIEASIPHIEAFTRYRIQKVAPSDENMRKLATALASLEAKASEIESVYHEQVPILTARAIRRYVAEIRRAVGVQ